MSVGVRGVGEIGGKERRSADGGGVMRYGDSLC